MSEKSDQYKGKIDSNPAESSPTMTNWWFIVSPYADKYIPYGGNAIKLLNCGEEYLPALLNAINNAKQSIYIAIWGFDDEMSLVLLGENDKPEAKNYISTVLQKKAAEGVEVKILVWYNSYINKIPVSAGGEPTLISKLRNNAWWDRALAGEFNNRHSNLQFLTRDPSNLHETPRGRARIEELELEKKKIQNQVTSPYLAARFPDVENFENQKKLDAIDKHIDRLKGAGVNADDVQLERIKKGKSISEIGSFPSHHQKMILIDHRNPEIANGFVQGFNLWPIYMDFVNHPYRNRCFDAGCLKETAPHAHRQDVGVNLQGPCLIDLFNNFKEAWNREIRGNAKKIDEGPPKIPPISPKKDGRYYAQILRTWPLSEEQQIYKFIQKAITQLNEFIYIEDQYFRMPELADLLLEQAAVIKEKSQGKKKLYIFVITSLNADAMGESSLR